MRVGLYGGSFNPAHEGHLHVARTARKALGLHKVVWLVSPQNPLKGTKETAPLARRLANARKTAEVPGMVASALEADLGSPYTVDTLRFLTRRYPAVRFFWLMGSDSLIAFHRWRRWREIADLAEVVVVPRPGSTVKGRLSRAGRRLRETGRVTFLEGPTHPASSTALRDRVRLATSRADQGE